MRNRVLGSSRSATRTFVHEHSVQPKVRGECLIETPQLLDAEPTDPLAEALHVDGANLLDEDKRRFAIDLDGRAKRRLPGAP